MICVSKSLLVFNVTTLFYHTKSINVSFSCYKYLAMVSLPAPFPSPSPSHVGGQKKFIYLDDYLAI